MVLVGAWCATHRQFNYHNNTIKLPPGWRPLQSPAGRSEEVIVVRFCVVLRAVLSVCSLWLCLILTWKLSGVLHVDPKVRLEVSGAVVTVWPPCMGVPGTAALDYINHLFSPIHQRLLRTAGATELARSRPPSGKESARRPTAARTIPAADFTQFNYLSNKVAGGGATSKVSYNTRAGRARPAKGSLKHARMASSRMGGGSRVGV